MSTGGLQWTKSCKSRSVEPEVGIGSQAFGNLSFHKGDNSVANFILN